MLNTPNSCCAENMLQLNPENFEMLAPKLSYLNSDPVSRLAMEKQLAIFMYLVGPGASNGQTQYNFQQSGKTVSCIFHHIISLIIKFAPTYIKAPTTGATHPVILDNPKFSPFFDDCLGALDGVHVQAKVRSTLPQWQGYS